jgi:hypothetical protein
MATRVVAAPADKDNKLNNGSNNNDDYDSAISLFLETTFVHGL